MIGVLEYIYKKGPLWLQEAALFLRIYLSDHNGPEPGFKRTLSGSRAGAGL